MKQVHRKPEPYVSTTNACKLCKPLGACLAFRGIEGAVPFLHGSQGCATYMRRYIISHFREPMDIASSSLGEKHAVYGGGPNLKQGLKNVMSKYDVGMIGIATTCLTETIGDDVPTIVNEFRRDFADVMEAHGSPALVRVSTPSYAGTHMEGFHATVKAVVDQLAEETEPHQGITPFPRIRVTGGYPLFERNHRGFRAPRNHPARHIADSRWAGLEGIREAAFRRNPDFRNQGYGRLQGCHRIRPYAVG